MEQEIKRKLRKKGKKLDKRLIPILVLVIIIGVIFIIWECFLQDRSDKEKTTIVTSSQLEKVLKISDLSTYKVTFNGVAAVNDDKDKLLYNVAYEAKVSIGFDMEKIKVDIDDTNEENKEIIVTMPKVEIMGAEVDAGTLDYIFEKESANKADIAMTALPACKEDAENECKSNELLFELAQENAVNTIKALTNPLLEQYEGYSLRIVDEGGDCYE